METYYRDYGSLGGNNAPNNEVQVTRRSLVFLATHGGDGSRLPLMNRSFISFTFGGKPIEDFNLIATINNNSLNRQGSADFEDTVSSYNNLDGLQYWSTHYKNNSIEFTLSTDGIDLQMLDSFLYWFRAGDTKELILAEHPNRAALARIAQPPHLDLLPFEEQVTHIIADVPHKTSTTLYKGDISLVFIMDEPHWYAIMNLLGRRDEELDCYIDLWWDPVSESWVNITDSKDALKVLYEDGIPLGSMINNNMLLGNGSYANVEDNVNSLIWSLPEADIVWNEGEPSGQGARIYGTITSLLNVVNSRFSIGTEAYGGPLTMEDGTVLSFDKLLTDSPLNGELVMSEILNLINTEEDDNINIEAPLAFISDWRDYAAGDYGAIIAGPIIKDDGSGIDGLLYLQNGYFFYSGTAPSPTIISFTLTPELNNLGYVSIPANSYAKNGSGLPYNTLTIESINKLELRFTTPNLYTSYNKVNEIATKYIKVESDKAWIDLREKFREDVRHPRVREWANKVIDSFENASIAINSSSLDVLSAFRGEMSRMILNGSTVCPASFVFNSETGKALAKFRYRVVVDSNFQTIEEDVGDMLRSNYIIIRDRNYATENGHIVAWQLNHPEYSHKVYHDVNSLMTNLQILYKNRYL